MERRIDGERGMERKMERKVGKVSARQGYKKSEREKPFTLPRP